MEVRDLFQKFKFEEEDFYFVNGSALCVLEDKNKEIGEDKIKELVDLMDTKIPLP